MKSQTFTPREAYTFFNRDSTIRDFVKKKKLTIFGGQSIVAQTGLLARNTKDWDIDDKTPRKDAVALERQLNRQSGTRQYYERESKYNKGVYKVIYKGNDQKTNTRDDIGIADFSKHNFSYVTINGVRYAKLSNTVADKKRALRNPQFAFRANKDREDLARIEAYNKFRKV